MSRPRRVFRGTELENEVLRALLRKALGLPRKGTRVGKGPWSNMPDTWDGNGPCPTGWANEAVDLHVGPIDTALELPDEIATELQGAPAQAKLTGPERAAVAQAIGQRVTIDLPANGYTLKLSAVQLATEEQK